MPWVLTQILDARNHLSLAVTELEGFLMEYGKQFTKDNLQQLLEYVSMCILRARDAVVFPNQLKMSADMQPFRPLPRDVSIDMRIASDRLLMTITATASMHAPHAPHVDRKGASSIVRGAMNDLLVPGEVVETLDAEASIPSLSDAISATTAAYDLAYRMHDKLSRFT